MYLQDDLIVILHCMLKAKKNKKLLKMYEGTIKTAQFLVANENALKLNQHNWSTLYMTTNDIYTMCVLF